MMQRSRRIDEVLAPSKTLGIWAATILIVLAGTIFVLFRVSEPARARRAQVDRVEPGAPLELAIDLIGVVPLRCPASPLDHLRSSLPTGWSPAAADVGIESLQNATAARMVFGRPGRTPAGCEPERGSTEIGVDSTGAVIWIVATLERTPVELPAWLAPGDAAPSAEAGN
jgi:hypothetical protein